MRTWFIVLVAGWLAASCTANSQTAGPALTSALAAVAAPGAPIVPLVDHHAHLVSARAALGSYPLPVKEVALPAQLAELLAARQRASNDPGKLAQIYTPDAVVLNTANEDLPSWIKGQTEVADHVASLFARPHRIKPVDFRLSGNRGFIAGYFHRPEIDRHFGHVLLSVVRAADGRWLIDAESPTFPGPPGIGEFDAAALIKELDDARIHRAVVLSVAYWYGSAFRAGDPPGEAQRVRAENDWVADQVARFPDRLVSFCSVNPLKPYALEEVRHCGETKRHRGLKLHFGNSDVDLRKPDHVQAVASVVAEANRHKLAIAAHLWTGPSFETEGGAHAQVFLDKIFPSAPDVPVQIAHLAGGGRTTLPALKVFADAIAARDSRTQNLWFDVATMTVGATPADLALAVEQMRRIGLDRIVFGSDTSQPSRPTRNSWVEWPALHAAPLTQAELRQVASNIAPYLQPWAGPKDIRNRQG